MRWPQAAGCDTSAAYGGHRLTAEDFISEWFYRVAEAMTAIPQPPLATLWPSERVTGGLLFALQGGGNRAFYRWSNRDGRRLFPTLPERTRLLRLWATHRTWPGEFLAPPPVVGVVDSSGSELLPPMRDGRSRQQIGRKGKATPRWIVGGKLCGLLTQGGSVGAWDGAGAHAPDTACPPLMETYEEARIIWKDAAFPAKVGEPAHRKLCDRGLWKTRMRVETVLSMLSGVCHL
jgi:hypothetical protein